MRHAFRLRIGINCYPYPTFLVNLPKLAQVDRDRRNPHVQPPRAPAGSPRPRAAPTTAERWTQVRFAACTRGAPFDDALHGTSTPPRATWLYHRIFRPSRSVSTRSVA